MKDLHIEQLNQQSGLFIIDADYNYQRYLNSLEIDDEIDEETEYQYLEELAEMSRV